MTAAALTVICLALIGFCTYREWAWARERDKLLQRIQAPQLATLPDFEQGAGYVRLDDDKAYWEYRGDE